MTIPVYDYLDNMPSMDDDPHIIRMQQGDAPPPTIVNAPGCIVVRYWGHYGEWYTTLSPQQPITSPRELTVAALLEAGYPQLAFCIFQGSHGSMPHFDERMLQGVQDMTAVAVLERALAFGEAMAVAQNGGAYACRRCEGWFNARGVRHDLDNPATRAITIRTKAWVASTEETDDD